MDNLQKLLKLPLVLEVKRIKLTKSVREELGLWGRNAISNNKKIFVYRIVYKSVGKKIVGYIVEPKKGTKLPCIIWNRGGSRDFGMMKHSYFFNDYYTIASLASRGYVVFITQYPGVDGGEGLDKMGSDDDLQSILDFYKIIKSYKRIDSTKIGMEGFSRGGMMTYMCLSKVKWIRAAVVGAASCDEINASKFRKGWDEHQKNIYGGSLAERKKRSAICWTDKFSKKTPILIMHGTSDWRVDPNCSLQMAKKLHGKIPYRLIMFEGADHGLNDFREEYQRQVFEWFDRFLKKNEKLPNIKPHGP